MALIIDGTTVENVLYKSSPTATPLQLDKLIFEGVTVWENWKLKTGWTLVGDFGNQWNCSWSRSFTKPIKIVDGQFKLRTAGGSNYPYNVQIKLTNGSWKTIASGSMNDTSVRHFSAENTECIGLSIGVCSSNSGVGRYPTEIKLNKYYEKG